MDQPVPNRPTDIKPDVIISPSSVSSSFFLSLKNLKSHLFLIFLIILLLLIFLNYFNIFTLPKASQLTTKPETKLSYSCPLSKNYCNQGLQVSLSNTKPLFQGLAYQNIASGSAVLAMIPGKFTTAVSVGKNTEKVTILTIENEQFGIEVDYQFKGKEYSPIGGNRGQVKQGETIGWVSDKNLADSFGKPYNLIVSVNDLKTKEFIRLKPQDLQ